MWIGRLWRRLKRAYRLFRDDDGAEPFIVTKIRDGVVTARRMDEKTGRVLPGGQVATFPLAKADYLAVGDITMLVDR